MNKCEPDRLLIKPPRAEFLAPVVQNLHLLRGDTKLSSLYLMNSEIESLISSAVWPDSRKHHLLPHLPVMQSD